METENAACSIVRMAEHKEVQNYMSVLLKRIFEPRTEKILIRIE
jgi:hypothetical protein